MPLRSNETYFSIRPCVPAHANKITTTLILFYPVESQSFVCKAPRPNDLKGFFQLRKRDPQKQKRIPIGDVPNKATIHTQILYLLNTHHWILALGTTSPSECLVVIMPRRISQNNFVFQDRPSAHFFLRQPLSVPLPKPQFFQVEPHLGHEIVSGNFCSSVPF